MESLFINAIVGFWIVVFGAGALFPMFMESSANKRTADRPTDDQVLSIQPVASHATVQPITRIPAFTPEHDQPRAA